MNLTAVSPDTHQTLYWHPPKNWEYARQRAVFPVLASEWPGLCTAFPTGFTKDHPVVILGIDPAFNLFIARDGSWLPGILPHPLRYAPFAVAASENDTLVLCVDEDAGSVTQDPEKGEPFFSSEGGLTEKVQQIVHVLQAQAQNRANTAKACELLWAKGVLTSWEAVVQTKAQGRVNLAGLYCIDENALNTLPGKDLLELRDTGALGMAYCQLISMQHLPRLGQLADAHAKLEEKYTDIQDFDLGQLLGDDDILKF